LKTDGVTSLFIYRTMRLYVGCQLVYMFHFHVFHFYLLKWWTHTCTSMSYLENINNFY